MYNVNDIEEFIIAGGNTAKIFKFKIGDKQKILRWSPITIERAQIAFARALDKVMDEQAKLWINTAPDKQSLIFGPEYKVSTAELLEFNLWNTLWTIKFGLEPHYPDITVQAIEQLPINRKMLYVYIATASGILKSQETARLFRGESEKQPDQDNAEQGSNVGTPDT